LPIEKVETQELRVLIVRLGAMGDILHALPAVTALRLAHPQWRMGWVVEPKWRGLLCAESATQCALRGPEMPLVDRVHLGNVKGWGKAPLSARTRLEIRALRNELRAEHYDICVDLQGALRSAWIARWAKPKRLIGEAVPREWAAKYLFDERVPTSGVHVIEQGVEVANAIAGDTLPIIAPTLPCDAAAEAWCDAQLGVDASGPIVLMSPGAGWGAKRWPPARYGQAAAELSKIGCRVIVNVGPDEAQLAAELVAESGGRALKLDPTLSQLIALTRRASLLIAGDTGPLHLACALGVPVVGIFGPTDPARNGPFGCRFRVLRHAGSKRDHSRRAAPEAGLLTIQPADVVNAAKELLREKG
jgi:heptosyltransferase-1